MNGEGAEQGGGENGTSDIESKLRAEFETKLQSALENNGAYRALQTALNRNVQKFQSDIQARDAKIAALEQQFRGASEGMEYLSGAVIRNLPEDERTAMEADLSKKQVQRISQELAELKQQRAQPPAAPEAAQLAEQEWTAILAEARESLEETAREWGIDPKTDGLDFGSDEEAFAKRLKKLNASAKRVKEAKEKADLESVRVKGTQPPTRTTSAGAPGEYESGRSLLSQGSEELWQLINKATPGTRRISYK